MATGTFIRMDKKRPGAYINFRGPEKADSVGTARGVVAFGLPLSWGPEGEVISLTAEEMANGSAQRKVGCVAADATSLPFRLALTFAHTALVYRLNTGGTRAAGTVGGLAVTAKHTGSVGNRISVRVSALGSKYEVVTYIDRREADRQVVAGAERLTDNDYVSFAGDELEAQAATLLGGGTDGTVDEATAYPAMFAALRGQIWNCLGCITDVADTKQLVVQKIRELLDAGMQVQAVLRDYHTADFEGIISTSQGYKTTAETVNAAYLPLLVAGMTAGAGVAQSNTYREIPDAAEIVGELSDEELTTGLYEGKFMLSRRQDRTIVVEQDINTLQTFDESRPAVFAKNRAVRVLGALHHHIVQMFENGYIGKVNNNETGRQKLRSDIISYMTKLADAGAIRNFNSNEDIDVVAGGESATVAAHLAVQPADSMEKLYMTVYAG